MLLETPSASAWPLLGVRQASDYIPHPKRVPVTVSGRDMTGGPPGRYPSYVTMSHLSIALLLHLLAIHRRKYFLVHFGTPFCTLLSGRRQFCNILNYLLLQLLPISVPKQVFQVNKSSHDSRSKYHCTPPAARRSLPHMISSFLFNQLYKQEAFFYFLAYCLIDIHN